LGAVLVLGKFSFPYVGKKKIPQTPPPPPDFKSKTMK